MTNFQLIQHLDACNLLKPLLQAGLMSTGILKKRDIYLCYDKEIRIGSKRTDAITHTAEDYRVCERYVYRVINEMEMESQPKKICELAA